MSVQCANLQLSEILLNYRVIKSFRMASQNASLSSLGEAFIR